MRYLLFASILLTTLVVTSIFGGDSSHAAPPLTPTPTPTPTSEVSEVAIEVTLQEGQAPIVRSLGGKLPDHIEPAVVHHRPKEALPPQTKVIQPKPLEATAASDGLVDNWQQPLKEDLEGTFPQISLCGVFDASDDGYDRFWSKHSFKPHNGKWAAWPAAGGVDDVNPAIDDYPANLKSRLRCGPFSAGQVTGLLVNFARWLDISDPDDNLFVGVSVDGVTYTGLKMSGVSDWATYNVYFNGLDGASPVSVEWEFSSDGDNISGQGAWIDDLEIWQYRPPSVTCGEWDSSNKGLVLPPYDPSVGGVAPIIRPGDTAALQQVAVSGARWVRLGLIQRNGVIDWRDYDRMVDSLCAKDISVLGLVNNESLVRQDFNNPTVAAAYRQEFAGVAAAAAQHFKGRIKYWEIWNEPNFAPDEKGSSFIEPRLYASLLADAAAAVKNVNPKARILFGGLASAWGDSNDYFKRVYARWDELGGVRPFDYFAVHPYPNVQYGPNPSVYMYTDPGYSTIADKFLETMATRNDGNKKIWITEVGWNSAKGSSNRPVCHDPVLVTEAEQAAYLKPMFDTLFGVKMWNDPSKMAVEKIMWYQYMDVGVPDPCKSSGLRAHSYIPARAMLPLGQNVEWRYGLYRGDKTTSKPVWCEFVSYPSTCAQYFHHRAYLPLVLK